MSSNNFAIHRNPTSRKKTFKDRIYMTKKQTLSKRDNSQQIIQNSSLLNFNGNASNYGNFNNLRHINLQDSNQNQLSGQSMKLNIKNPAIQPKRNQDLFQQNRNLQNNQHPNYNQKGLTLTQQQQQNFINNSQNQFDVNNSQSSIIGIKPEMMIMINDVNQSGFNEKNTYNINKSGQQVQNWQQRGRNSQNQRISSRFASQQNREIQQVQNHKIPQKDQIQEQFQEQSLIIGGVSSLNNSLDLLQQSSSSPQMKSDLKRIRIISQTALKKLRESKMQ
eukprot:403343718